MNGNNTDMQTFLRRIIVSGPIREDTAMSFLEQITALECMDVTKTISVYINTYGGNVDSAICMYDAMKSCTCPVVTIGMGKVMSAGVLLLAAGDKGKRYISENTRVMIHEISAEVYGAVSDMKSSLDEVHGLQDTYVNLLAQCTGKSKTKILKDMENTLYMNATDTIKYGIVDRVITARKDIKVVKKNTKSKKKVAKKTK